MRLAHRALWLGALACAAALADPVLRAAWAQGAQEQPPNPNDILGNLVVVAGATRPLPKIAVVPSLASNIEDVTLRSVVWRDLDLCGEFEVLPDSEAPEGSYLSGAAVDVKAWARKGVEAVVKVAGTKLDSGKIELASLAYFVTSGGRPVFEQRLEVDAGDVRPASHRISDALIGALTGSSGGFASQMTFIVATGRSRRVYVIDADGHEPRAVSTEDHFAVSPAFGPGGKLYYAASVNHDEFKIFASGSAEPVAVNIPGSVYGLAFSRAGDKVAVSVAQGANIRIFWGGGFDRLQRLSGVGTALHPAFLPDGRLGFSGAAKWGQRIHVGEKPISPAGLHASAPVFCRHPDGVRVVYAVGVGKDTDLVASDPSGGGLVRLTQGQGRNGYPACSADGRLVAFFSTRRSGEGPGLYLMRLDGLRPKRISTLVGDSLRWGERLPPPGPAK
ncbi:MAG: PD40 domain-containing protein [Deltaproteobacteria bacterium]|nr:PD40 domain-containing protein [Deltaproteobacteria bacterium]